MLELAFLISRPLVQKGRYGLVDYSLVKIHCPKKWEGWNYKISGTDKSQYMVSIQQYYSDKSCSFFLQKMMILIILSSY